MDFCIFRMLYLFFILIFTMSLNSIFAPRNLSQEKHIVDDYNFTSRLRSISLQPKSIKITPGFYYRKSNHHNASGDRDYNEYDWIYIKHSHEVQFFSTLDGENCLVDLAYEKSPQQIYRNIKRNKAEFLKLICECNKNEHAPYYRNVPFTKVSESSLFHKTQLDSLYFTEEISFIKKGAILKITGTHGELYEDVYEFAGQ